jgi:hypothetical protein
MKYRIEKQSPGASDGTWEAAWGLKPRSYPNAADDTEAVLIFRREVARCRTPHRLVRLDGYGYRVDQTILAQHPEERATP